MTRVDLEKLNQEAWRLAHELVVAREVGDEVGTRRLEQELAAVCLELVPGLREWEATCE